jgi:hypothetical protein
MRLYAAMLYLTNTAHSFGDHEAVKALFTALRPAFKIPIRHQLANNLLHLIYEEVAAAVYRELQKATCIAGTSDGWSRTQGDVSITNFQACIMHV